MKLVTAVVKPFALDEVKERLEGLGVRGMTVAESRGLGRQTVQADVDQDGDGFVPKVRIEVLVEDDIADEVVEAIIESARTGSLGDGKVWVTTPSDAYRVRTGESGADAV